MKKKIALATLAILPMTAASAHAGGETGIVTATSLNVRSGASTSHKVLFTVKKNEQVDITGSSNGWYKIKAKSGKEGWASSTYISKNSSTTESTSGSQKQVRATSLNMRNGAGTSYRIITVLKQGEIVEVMSQSNGWSKIKYDGRIGYVSSEYLEDIKLEGNVTKVVNIEDLNVRTGPSTSYSIIGKLQPGDKVSVISESNGWSKISYNGKVAYVSSRYLDKEATTPEKPSQPQKPSTPEVATETRTVNTDGLNVRKGPSTSYQSISKLSKGTKVEVISDDSNGWSKIKHNGGEAYVATRYLDKQSVAPEKPSTPEVATETRTVNTDGLNVRKGPSTSYQSISKLSKGTKVEVISDDSNGWSKIKHNGGEAYVATRYLDKQNVAPEKPSQPEKPSTPEVTTETRIVNIKDLNVRKGPSTSYESIAKLQPGDKVEVISDNSNGWTKIKYNASEAYVATRYLDRVNEGTSPEVGGSQNVNGATINYKALNYSLASHVSRQYDRISVGGNVIDSSKPRSIDVAVQALTVAQARGFVNADRSDLEYFLNPANFTKSSKGMMQFLRIDSYKGGVSVDELNGYLNSLGVGSLGTNVFHGQGQAFINAAQKYNIDLVYLVSHAMWETGYGKSVLAQGQTITSYKGKPLDQPTKVYNFFGIGAIDKSANVSGAEAAYSNGWTSIEATIEGSAQWIAQNYIKSSKYNQNTIYKMKWNYDYTWHQYATDVNWCNGIAGIMNKLISLYDTGSNLVFEVPQYK